MVTSFQLSEHLNKVNFITPQGERFFFQGADIPAVYDLVNWQTTGHNGPLKLVIVGRVDGSHLHLNQSAIQWRTGSSQVSTVPGMCRGSWLKGSVFNPQCLHPCRYAALSKMPKHRSASLSISLWIIY